MSSVGFLRVIRLPNGLTALLISDRRQLSREDVECVSALNDTEVSCEDGNWANEVRKGTAVGDSVVITNNCDHSGERSASAGNALMTADNRDKSDVIGDDDASSVMTDDGDSSWTDATSSNSGASLSSSDENDNFSSQDSADDDGIFSGGFHGGQHRKRSCCKQKDCSSEKLVYL
jgi:hypothetical protein